MKTNKLFMCLGVMAAMTMASCQKEALNGIDGSANGENDPEYMTVRISSPIGTRAENSGEGTYVDGSDAENTIATARFYFFKSDGNAANVVKKDDGSYTNFIDWVAPTMLDPSQNQKPNVEKVTEVKLIIDTQNGDHIPSKLAVICNGGAIKTGLNALSQQSRNNIKNYVLNAEGTSYAFNPATSKYPANGVFMMSNSVYARTVTADNLGVFATDILGSNICKTEEEAKQNPVEVYVERVLAKVKGSIGLDASHTNVTLDGETYNAYALKDAGGADFEVDGKQVYAAINGWNVTAVAPKTGLGKTVNPDWTSSDLFGTASTYVWNYPLYSRSFWAVNRCEIVLPTQVPYNGTGTPNANQMRLQYGDFSDASLIGWGENDCQYLYENAATTYMNEAGVANWENNTESDGEHTNNLKFAGDHKYDTHTQVIIPARLVVLNSEDKLEPLTLYNWLGTDYASENDLKVAMADKMKTTLYRREITTEPTESGTPTTTTYTGLAPEDLQFLTLQDLKENANEAVPSDAYRRYAIYPSLSDDALDDVENKPWGVFDEAGKFQTKTPAQVNEMLKTLLPAKGWKGGNTYYYFNIRHLGNTNTPGYEGVVRNHLYNFTINKIVGLGTPVYDPNETIITETVEDQNSYIDARINVLAWRVVNQDIVLQ